MTVAFTGHRPHKLGYDYDLVKPLSIAIANNMAQVLADLETTHIITGMALGVDTIAANVAILMGIPFTAAVPFKGQESLWPARSQSTYKALLAKAQEVVYVCEPGYAAWKMQKRNEWMVDNAQVLIAVWDGTPGGTGNCVNYAKNRIRIAQINPTKLKQHA